MKTVLTIGTFDLPHNGHFNLLRRAKALGDKLIVAINTDEFVEQYKGVRPVMTLDQRASIIENCKWVDAVIINPDRGIGAIDVTNPNILAVGGDWLERDYEKQIGSLEELRVHYLPYTSGISSTYIRERLRHSDSFTLKK